MQLSLEVAGMIFSRAFKWVDELLAADATGALTGRLGRIIVGMVNGFVLSAIIEKPVNKC